MGSFGAVGILWHRVNHVGNAVEFDAAHKCLAEETHCIDCIAPLSVCFLKFSEHLAEAVIEVFPASVPSTYLVFELLLLTYNTQVGNRLVHADAVLPVVAAAGPFAGVLDADGAVCIHEAFPHFLLLAAHLYGADVESIHALIDAPRTQVAAGASRIAYCHTEVPVLVAVHSDTGIVVEVQGNILRAVVGRLSVLVGIDAEDAEVASLARPHPVVGIAAELAHCLRGGEDKSDVAIDLVIAHIKGIVLVVSPNQAVESGISCLQLFLYGSHDAVGVLFVEFRSRFAGMFLIDFIECPHDAACAFFGAL